jgi:hypothetical protein
MGPASTSRFQTTSWSLVIAAAGRSSTEARGALANLCQTYWRPVYSFIRRSGYPPDQAQDLTQGFFLVLLDKNYLADADRQRGRFRSFLLTSVKNFVANERDRAYTLKRGGGQSPCLHRPDRSRGLVCAGGRGTCDSRKPVPAPVGPGAARTSDGQASRGVRGNRESAAFRKDVRLP